MKQERKIWRIIILLIIMVFVLAVVVNAQNWKILSPKYYPIETEMALKLVPMTATGIEYGTALPTWFQKHKKGLAITAIQLASVVLDATGDAVYDIGKESGNSSKMTLGHSLQACAIGVIGVSVVSLSWKGSIWDGVRFGIGWLGMRYALHDLSYNLARGIDPLYADGLKAKMPPSGRVFTQALSFGFSVSWNILEF